MNDTDSQDRVSKYDGSYVLVMPGDLAFYWQAINGTDETPERIEELKRFGWLPLSESDHRIVALQSMHAKMQALRQGEHKTIWVHAHQLVKATDVPVALASRLDRKGIAEAIGRLDNDDPILLEIINPLPLPDWGTVGVIWRDEINITSIELEALPPEGLRLQQEIRALILDTSLGITVLWTYAPGEPGEEIKQAVLAMRASIEADEQAYNETIRTVRTKAGELAKMYLDYYKTSVVSGAKVLQDLPNTVNVFKGNKRGAPVITGQGVMGVINFFNATATVKGLDKMGSLTLTPDQIPNYRRSTAETLTDVQYRGVAVEKLIADLYKMSTSIDTDVFLCFIMQFILGDKIDGNTVWITAESIMEARGLEKIRGNEGYRQEQYDEVAQAVNRIENLWMTIYQKIFEDPTIRKGKKRKTQRRIEDRVIIIKKRVAHDELRNQYEIKSSRHVAWRFELGEWHELYLTGANRQIGYMSQKLIQYDPHNATWEKKIGLHLTFNLRMNHQHMTRTIGNMLEELGLPIDTRNPEKTKTRFEKAMNTLQTDGIISLWQYQDNSDLPPRQWLTTWLDRKVDISG